MHYIDLSQAKKKLEVGKTVSFKISCDDKTLRKVPGGFAVNFQAHYDDYANIALHFNPREKSSKVVVNTRINKKWEAELHIEDDMVGHVYFGSPFELKINVNENNHVLIYVNGKFKTGYFCKIDITTAKYLCFPEGVRIMDD
ncbi:Hypothetical predicted protein [Mytilus galloprovincialis]|uniref:Galectin n=1 Tax=Mytilus galloprovincialis TaxID=29158 RepID=A0A8B6CCR5_MYTGA|nr:Hypothetical predicted protein [Mytilus galloprovincialis]